MVNKFLKKFFYFILGFVLLTFIYFQVITHFTMIHGSIYQKDFLKQINHFENFISQNENINLVIGSSYMISLDANSFQGNWVNFSNGGQNIYESYKFLHHYINKTKIDTIVLGINPFDFRDSISKYFDNGNFYYFGIDSNNFSDFRSMLQVTKDNIFRLKNPKNNNYYTKPNRSQYKYNLSILDSNEDLFMVGDVPVDNHIIYFSGVKKLPNMDYFNLFYNLTKKNDITLICLFTPKSIYWRDGLNKLGLDITWNHVKDSLSKKDLIIWDLEDLFLDNVPKNYFENEDHPTSEGDVILTNLIRKRLIKISSNK